VEITADQHLEGGKFTHGGHQQFLMNNSINNMVWQFNYGGFNSAIHLLIEFVAAELFKFKSKMSALKIRCRSPAEGGKMHPTYRECEYERSYLENKCSDWSIRNFRAKSATRIYMKTATHM